MLCCADDIGHDEDAKFQSLVEGDTLKAHARALFEQRMSTHRPATAVALDGSGPAPPTPATITAAATPLASASSSTTAAAAAALDLVRDVLLLYALVCDVFTFFNAQTQSIFKKKPPEVCPSPALLFCL